MFRNNSDKNSEDSVKNMISKMGDLQELASHIMHDDNIIEAAQDMLSAMSDQAAKSSTPADMPLIFTRNMYDYTVKVVAICMGSIVPVFFSQETMGMVQEQMIASSVDDFIKDVQEKGK